MEKSLELTMGVVVTGIVVIFLALTLLIIVVAVFGFIFRPKENKPKKEAVEVAKEMAPQATVPAAPKSDDSVIAAISAAIYCVLGEGFKIKNIRPAKKGVKNVSQWEMSGRQNNVLPF